MTTPHPAAAQAQEPDDWLHLKAYGYAPGNYMGKCRRCGQIADDIDKRATTCRPCAEKLHAAQVHQEAEHPAPAGQEDLIQRLNDEADLCRNDGANDIARLLDEAATALSTPSPQPTSAAGQPLSEACEWHSDDDGLWHSACGGDPWLFEAEDPTKNGMRFCIHCGKRMVQRAAPKESA